MNEVFICLRIAAVIACLCVAAAIATPKGRVPLALRGMLKMLRKDLGSSAPEAPARGVSVRRRLIALLLVILAATLAAHAADYPIRSAELTKTRVTG